jgi:hypothetical protein
MQETKPKRSRLGTQMRGALAEKYGLRGKGKSHLWYFYSPKANQDFVVASDIEFGHALLVESDPRIKRVNYSPPIRRAVETKVGSGTVFDAELGLTDGSIELREVKYSASIKTSADDRTARQLRVQAEVEHLEHQKGRACRHVVMTEVEIFARPQLIRNWFAALPWIAQARFHSKLSASNEVAALIHGEGRVTFGQLINDGGPLFAAVALQGVANGKYTSDLDRSPFCRRTQIYGGRP